MKLIYALFTLHTLATASCSTPDDESSKDQSTDPAQHAVGDGVAIPSAFAVIKSGGTACIVAATRLATADLGLADCAANAKHDNLAEFPYLVAKQGESFCLLPYQKVSTQSFEGLSVCDRSIADVIGGSQQTDALASQGIDRKLTTTVAAETETFFEVQGNSYCDLNKSVTSGLQASIAKDSAMPASCAANKTIHGCTGWGVYYSYSDAQFSNFAVSTKASIHIPRLAASVSLPASLASEWQRYSTLLQAHEHKHALMARVVALLVANWLRNHEPAASTTAAERQAFESSANAFITATTSALRLDEVYDTISSNGSSEGVRLANLHSEVCP